MRKMKKSELKARIAELEVEKNNAVAVQKMWRYLAIEIMNTLQNQYNVKIDLSMPEPPKIDCTLPSDTERKTISGIIDSTIPVINFDFTEHDLNVLEKREVIK